MKKTVFLPIAAFLGATGVALGAMGAHALKEKVKLGLMLPEQLAAWDTASKYQLLHAIALLFVALFADRYAGKLLNAAGWLFTAGVLLFSGSIYLLSTQGISGMEFRFLGPVTPLGGLCMITGWIMLLVFGLKLRAETK